MNRLAPNRLSTANVHGGVFGGATSAVVALPLAVAFGLATQSWPRVSA